ncbi:PEGA domain-containing protein [bacterium]|nr:PEGA domain-containing protein [bacterium]
MQGSLQSVAYAAALSLGLAALAGAFATPKKDRVGRLLVQSDPPQAEVWLDGTVQGRTPLTLTPKSGKHRLELRKKGFYQALVSVDFPSTRSVSMRLPPKQATLSLNQVDKAEIQLGPGVPRRLRGQGPWKLSPGSYEVTARRGPIQARPKKFEIKPGQDLRISLVWPNLPVAPAPFRPVPSPPVSLPYHFPVSQPAFVAPPYTPPRQPYYRPPARTDPPPTRPEPLFTPIPPSRPAPPVYEPPPGDEPLFTPLP